MYVLFIIIIFPPTKSTNMACDDCETECCNSLEIIDGGVTTKYCCQHIPKEINSKSSALIVRFHKDLLSADSKGFVLKWSE